MKHPILLILLVEWLLTGCTNSQTSHSAVSDQTSVCSDTIESPLIVDSTDIIAQELCGRRIVLDSHADTPLEFAHGSNLGIYSPKIQVSIPRLRKGGVGAQYLACWVKQGPLTDTGRLKARARITELIDSVHSQIRQNDTACALAWSVPDVLNITDQGKIAMLIGVENGYGIGHDLDGGGGVPGFNGSEDFANIEPLLRNRGLSDDEINKILGGNFLRVLSVIQSAANH